MAFKINDLIQFIRKVFAKDATSSDETMSKKLTIKEVSKDISAALMNSSRGRHPWRAIRRRVAKGEIDDAEAQAEEAQRTRFENGRAKATEV